LRLNPFTNNKKYMRTEHFDAVVIGSGPGGEAAAMRLTKGKYRVAIIEKYARVGGSCTHYGTIPSKSLRQSIQSIMEFRRDPFFASAALKTHVTYQQLLNRANQIINDQVALRERHYQRNRVPVITGTARFLDANSIEVMQDDAHTLQLSFDHAVIATGSSPYHPDDVDFSQPNIVDADSILNLTHTPRSITIYGAGVIGCEYASIFINLGLKVNLVNTRDKLLSYLDDEITDALGYHLRDQGVVIRHNEQYQKVTTDAKRVTLHCESGKQFSSEYLLWANGRSGNAARLNLEALGVEVNHRDQVVVNNSFQTTLPHIYAVGDVIGPPGLASASYDQGRFVGAKIDLGESDWELVKDVPNGIYTSPEISSIGATEKELTDKKVPYDVAHTLFKTIARAQITGRTTGVLKMLFHRETLEILGIHCFGDNAAEIIHIGQAIMRQKGEANSLRYFAETTFNYPTMAEAYRVAALNGLNRVDHED